MGTAAQQGEIWGARAKDWAEINEPLWKSVYEAVLDAAHVTRGSRYLDVGCGAGGALVLADRRGAVVSGLDASANLVAIARTRLPQARIEQGEMEELPFDDASFDAVSGINSFQFAGNTGNALREALRVCRPGGTAAMLVWGRREDCELLTRVMPAVFALLPPAPAGAPPPLPLGEAGIVEKLMAEAGFSSPSGRDFAWQFSFPDMPTAVRVMMSAAARAIAHAGEAAVSAAILNALAPLVHHDGSAALNNRMRLVTAVKPN